MTPDASPPLPQIPSATPLSQDGPAHPPAPTRIEDTASADVGDNAANEAADAMIEQSERDPVRPGQPADSHTRQSTQFPTA